MYRIETTQDRREWKPFRNMLTGEVAVFPDADEAMPYLEAAKEINLDARLVRVEDE